MTRQTDSFTFEPEHADWIEAFELAPVPASAIDSRLDAGESLHTVDIPAHLDRALHADCDASDALYRLTQLFGTPNVRPYDAGAEAQPSREEVTWQYLFRCEYDDGDAQTELFVSVYDRRTSVSIGVSHFVPDDDGSVETPSETPVDGADVPGEEFLEALVQLLLNTVQKPVRATYNDLWV